MRLVGQMHQLLLRLDQRGEHAELLPLEGAEIGGFRDAPALAQPLQHLVEAGSPTSQSSSSPHSRAKAELKNFSRLSGP